MKIKKYEHFTLLSEDGKFLKIFKYEPGKEIHTHLGKVTLKNKLNYGEILLSSKNKKFFVLKPSLSDLMMSIERKTTIIYPKDAGLILLELGIKPNQKVCEVGTGSGAFLSLISSVVGKKGKIYTFERRKEFYELAKKNLSNYKLFNNIEFFLRDVEAEGFPEIKVDAVFIDIPEPWKIIKFVPKILKKGHPLGSLSPNIEQIQKTKKEMEINGFVRIRVYEILLREIMVRDIGTRPKEFGIIHTGYLIFGNLIFKSSQ
ncbi:MAG: tRNA (adenine-N1)-methyltransferase [Candidatus Hydrothermales bacterium]